MTSELKEEMNTMKTPMLHNGPCAFLLFIQFSPGADTYLLLHVGIFMYIHVIASYFSGSRRVSNNYMQN